MYSSVLAVYSAPHFSNDCFCNRKVEKVDKLERSAAMSAHHNVVPHHVPPPTFTHKVYISVGKSEIIRTKIDG